MNTLVRDSLLRERLMATLSGFFGALAGLLATIGLYGVMSYMVERRRGTRSASASRSAPDRRDVVIAMIMREAAVLLGVGLIVGDSRPSPRRGGRARCSSVSAQAIRLTLGTGGCRTDAVAVLASYVPAWRASRLEPTEALREE